MWSRTIRDHATPPASSNSTPRKLLPEDTIARSVQYLSSKTLRSSSSNSLLRYGGMKALGRPGDEDDSSQSSFSSADSDSLSEITKAAHKLSISDRARERELCGPSCVLRRPFTLKKIPQRQPDNLQAPSKARLNKLAKALYQKIHPWQTRILKLKAGLFDDPIICDLLVVDLIAETGVGILASSEIVEYEALSYSWGWPEFTSSVFCNGSDFPVTQHLADALRHLRSIDEARYLWTDAFCINQSDDEEKSRQVQNMLLIFQKAVRVVAWLGIQQTDNVHTFAALKALSTNDIASGRHQPSCYENFNRIRKAADRILRNSWFSRTWVRQEVFATDQVVLYCGSHSIHFGKFVQGFRKLRTTKLPPEYRSKPGMTLAEYRSFDALNQSYSKLYVQRSWTWTYEALRTFLEGAAFGVTDPRDRVYGMMGIVCQYQRADMSESKKKRSITKDTRNIPTIPIDYTKTASEVFQDFVKFLIQQSGCLDVLTVFQDKTDSESDLPSWVIDIEHLRRFVMLKYPVSWEEKKRTPLQSLEGADPQELRLCGRRVYVALPLKHIALPWSFTSQKDWRQAARSLVAPFRNSGTVVECLQACSYVHGRPEQLGKYGIYQMWKYTVVLPSTAEDGDFFAYLFGGDFPFLLRPHPSTPDRYMLVGPVVFLSTTTKWRDADYYPMRIERIARSFGFGRKEDFILV